MRRQSPSRSNRWRRTSRQVRCGEMCLGSSQAQLVTINVTWVKCGLEGVMSGHLLRSEQLTARKSVARGLPGSGSHRIPREATIVSQLRESQLRKAAIP